ncbi:MAG: response regulator, partial [Nitrospiraceae bacterium]|nr:response regulator [Nitrospiraceae bacterium]
RQDVSKAPAGQVEPGRGETILLVEDDALVRRATASILTAYGYTVLAAANGAEALEVHREHRAAIRLVLLDVIMPGMNGEQVYEALAAVEPGLKVIFLSGYPQEVLEQKKLAEVMYLPKPVAPADLIKAIKTILAPA